MIKILNFINIYIELSHISFKFIISHIKDIIFLLLDQKIDSEIETKNCFFGSSFLPSFFVRSFGRSAARSFFVSFPKKNEHPQTLVESKCSLMN
jgi:hypothetical protein